MKLLIPCPLHTPLPAFPLAASHPTTVSEVFGFNHFEINMGENIKELGHDLGLFLVENVSPITLFWGKVMVIFR